MSNPSPIVVFVEEKPDVMIAEQVLRPYNVSLVRGGTTSSALGHAQGSLLDHPERPVGLLVNAGVDNPRTVAEYRGAMRRLMAQAHWENWYAAMAVPNLLAWIRTDPHFRQELDAMQGEKVFYADRAARVREVAREHPFDPSELLRTEPDFRGLVEFLQRHGAGLAKGARSAAS